MKKDKYAIVKIVPVAAVVAFFSISSFIPALRPTYSEAEKRELTKQPELHVSDMMDGSYFSAYDLWFADTFPFREILIDGDLKIKRLYGLQNTYIHGDIEQADEIPDVPKETPSASVPSSAVTTPTAKPVVTPAPTNPVVVPSASAGATGAPVNTPGKSDTPGDVQPQTLGAVLLMGDSAYEYYSFNQANSDKYADVISAYAEALKGQASVYCMIIPNSMAIIPDDSVLSGINTSDQNKAINYIYSQMSDRVHKVYLYDTLKEHREEYIYFRTDHHWTSLGAFYAYEQFAAVKGMTPNMLTSFETMAFPGYLGSFYTQTGKPQAMESNPDTVFAYVPMGTNELHFTDKSGTVTKWKVVSNVSSWNQSAKYSTFIGGDNPYSVIRNPNVTNGQSCLVIKESYGNAFVPFLVDHYETVHVIDYRYYKESITAFVKENQVTDVIFANNIIATRSEAAIGFMNDRK